MLRPASALDETETLHEVFENVDDDDYFIDCDDEAGVALPPHDGHQPQIAEEPQLTMSGSSAQSAPQAAPVPGALRWCGSLRRCPATQPV